MLGIFVLLEEPDYRNFDALDFVISELRGRARAVGARAAQLERTIIAERAVAKDIPRTDIEAAITILVMAGQLSGKTVYCALLKAKKHSPLPSEQRRNARGQPMRKDARAGALPLVKDVIERRTDARPARAKPLDAFAEELDKLGYLPFGIWWIQTVTELS